MMEIDWGALISGFAAGAGVSALFFTGLAISIRIALRAAKPTSILLLSAALRIGLVLAVGWLIAQSGGWALTGYAVAFLLVRHLSIILSRSRALPGGSLWN